MISWSCAEVSRSGRVHGSGGTTTPGVVTGTPSRARRMPNASEVRVHPYTADTSNDPLGSIRLGMFSGYLAIESLFKQLVASRLVV
jgi:hypothetical protein